MLSRTAPDTRALRSPQILSRHPGARVPLSAQKGAAVVDRVLVAGISGSGKTTMARTLTAQLGLRHYELDALQWAWSQHDRKRRTTTDKIRRHPHLTVVHLRTARQAAAWRDVSRRAS